VEEKGYITYDDIYRLLATSHPPNRNAASIGSNDAQEDAKETHGPMSSNLLQGAASFKREMSSTLFSRGQSVNGLVKSPSKENSRRVAANFGGRERINESGNIVLKQHETEASREARMQRIHMKVVSPSPSVPRPPHSALKVKGIIEQADQDGDGKIR
jgi:hypothetical protein